MGFIESIKKLTLVLILDEKEGKVLLGMKKRGFGAGKFNGFGGKVEPGETIEEGARRELLEEAEIEAVEMTKIGINLFSFSDDPVALETHVYIVTSYKGTPTETEEMKPEWFSLSDIPFTKMWLDDQYWFPFIFRRAPFMGYVEFTQDHKTIVLQKYIEISDDSLEKFDFCKVDVMHTLK